VKSQCGPKHFVIQILCYAAQGRVDSPLFYPAGEKGSSPPLSFENFGLREADSCRFPDRGLAQRRLARDWSRIYDTNGNIAGAGGPFFCEAVSAHRSRFSEALCVHATARRETQAAHPC